MGFDQWKLEQRTKLKKDFAISPIFYDAMSKHYDGTTIRELILVDGDW